LLFKNVSLNILFHFIPLLLHALFHQTSCKCPRSFLTHNVRTKSEETMTVTVYAEAVVSLCMTQRGRGGAAVRVWGVSSWRSRTMAACTISLVALISTRGMLFTNHYSTTETSVSALASFLLRGFWGGKSMRRPPLSFAVVACKIKSQREAEWPARKMMSHVEIGDIWYCFYDYDEKAESSHTV